MRPHKIITPPSFSERENFLGFAGHLEVFGRHSILNLKGLIYKNLQNAAAGVWHLDQWYSPRSSVAPKGLHYGLKFWIHSLSYSDPFCDTMSVPSGFLYEATWYAPSTQIEATNQQQEGADLCVNHYKYPCIIECSQSAAGPGPGPEISCPSNFGLAAPLIYIGFLQVFTENSF